MSEFIPKYVAGRAVSSLLAVFARTCYSCTYSPGGSNVLIRSYRNKETQDVHNGKGSRRLVDLTRKAIRKLDQIHNAVQLVDLASPPGNRLEPLKGRAKNGQYSIRVNLQWRICFIWDEETGDAEDVEIVDYHDESRSFKSGSDGPEAD